MTARSTSPASRYPRRCGRRGVDWASALSLPSFTREYYLPAEFLVDQLTARLGRSIQGFKDPWDPRTVLIQGHVARSRARVRGLFSGCTPPGGGQGAGHAVEAIPLNGRGTQAASQDRSKEEKSWGRPPTCSPSLLHCCPGRLGGGLTSTPATATSIMTSWEG